MALFTRARDVQTGLPGESEWRGSRLAQQREMRSAWWDIKELLFVHSVSTRTETNMAPPNARAIRTCPFVFAFAAVLSQMLHLVKSAEAFLDTKMEPPIAGVVLLSSRLGSHVLCEMLRSMAFSLPRTQMEPPAIGLVPLTRCKPIKERAEPG